MSYKKGEESLRLIEIEQILINIVENDTSSENKILLSEFSKDLLDMLSEMNDHKYFITVVVRMLRHDLFDRRLSFGEYCDELYPEKIFLTISPSVLKLQHFISLLRDKAPVNFNKLETLSLIFLHEAGKISETEEGANKQFLFCIIDALMSDWWDVDQTRTLYCYKHLTENNPFRDKFIKIVENYKNPSDFRKCIETYFSQQSLNKETPNEIHNWLL